MFETKRGGKKRHGRSKKARLSVSRYIRLTNGRGSKGPLLNTIPK